MNGTTMLRRSVDLPKWSALTVVGASVTREQAAEIIVRTNDWFLGTNDRAWEADVMGALGVPLTRENGYTQVSWGKVVAATERLGGLSLEYLRNSRVMSAWVGGPHGWCDWDGTIGSSNYNVGKWPSVKAVRAEWARIAEAFPFLDLRAQLWSGETSEEGIVPLVEFVVRRGKVRATSPKKPVGVPCQAEQLTDLRAPGRERGCDLPTLRWALGIVGDRVGRAPRDWDRLLE